MNTKSTEKLKEEFFKLVKLGYTKSRVSRSVGITESTASKWMKKKNRLKTLKESVLKELESLKYEPTTTTTERINELLEMLERLKKAESDIIV